MGVPSKIHLVTRAYLAEWAPAPARVVRPVDKRWGPQKPKNPAALGWALNWWGDDPTLNAACENACQALETLIAAFFPNLGDGRTIPGGDPRRGLIAQFVALHI